MVYFSVTGKKHNIAQKEIQETMVQATIWSQLTLQQQSLISPSKFGQADDFFYVKTIASQGTLQQKDPSSKVQIAKLWHPHVKQSKKKYI